MALQVDVYEDDRGVRPFDQWFAFDQWFDRLPIAHAAKVTIAVRRIGEGHTSNLKAVGSGVSEWRIDWGPGLRIYVAHDGRTLVLLLGGGTKARQQADMAQAIDRWLDYKRRRKIGGH